MRLKLRGHSPIYLFGITGGAQPRLTSGGEAGGSSVKYFREDRLTSGGEAGGSSVKYFRDDRLITDGEGRGEQRQIFQR